MGEDKLQTSISDSHLESQGGAAPRGQPHGLSIPLPHSSGDDPSLPKTGVGEAAGPVSPTAGTYQAVSPRLQLDFGSKRTGGIIYCRLRG